jgi:hypothetical protein
MSSLAGGLVDRLACGSDSEFGDGNDRGPGPGVLLLKSPGCWL